jgi:exopolyphosphatase/guanosine-5'-triphosphate,3'-diphosphate pyrophosphatase
MIALLARYHRKGTPAVGDYAPLLKEGDETRLRQLAALLRLSEYLERGRSGIVRDVLVRWDRKDMWLKLVADQNPMVELWITQRNGLDLMEAAFGRSVVLESAARV